MIMSESNGRPNKYRHYTKYNHLQEKNDSFFQKNFSSNLPKSFSSQQPLRHIVGIIMHDYEIHNNKNLNYLHRRSILPVTLNKVTTYNLTLKISRKAFLDFKNK